MALERYLGGIAGKAFVVWERVFGYRSVYVTFQTRKNSFIHNLQFTGIVSPVCKPELNVFVTYM